MHNFDVTMAFTGSGAIVNLFRGKTVSFSFSYATGVYTLSSIERLPYQLVAGPQFLDPASNLIYAFAANGISANGVTVYPLASISDRTAIQSL